MNYVKNSLAKQTIFVYDINIPYFESKQGEM